jgi:hypothetical protein
MQTLIRAFFLIPILGCKGPLSDSNYAGCPASGGKIAIADVKTVEELEAIEAENPTASCERLRYDDDATILIDGAATDIAAAREKYAEAAVILARLVEFYPEEYSRYGRLAAAYAGSAGIEMTTFLKSMAAGSSGIFEMGNETLASPDDETYDADKENLKAAVAAISDKIAREAKATIPTGDQLQLTVYQMAKTLIIANGFLVKNADGTWDQSKIDDLGPEDVDEIIESLDSIAEQIPSPEGKAKLEAFRNSSDLTDDEKKELLRKALEKKG